MNDHRGFDRERLAELRTREAARFIRANPRSAELARRASQTLYGGVPMHWMADWSTPFPLFVDHARGARFTDVDGHEYADFCLGDTGAMFGHAPEAVAAAVVEQARRGYTTMLPSEDAIAIGRELQRRFGLPFWQVATTATDANRWALRWARAVTGRELLLVFDGCYHGTVDETLVRLRAGRTEHRAGLLGQVQDLTRFTRVVEFNDLDGLRAALAPGDVAAVLAEPVMTNIGMVLPEPGFLAQLRELTRAAGTLLIMDETHTISTGIGGYSGTHGLQPDLLVLGKPVAGGLPCSVFGVTAEVARRMDEARAAARGAAATGHGHSGMGTTLSGNAFTLHAMRANLESVMTRQAYAAMQPLGRLLHARLEEILRRRQVPWCLTRVGARVEFQFRATPPRTGREAESAFDDELEQYVHLFLLNHGVMITPFHNMMLVCPDTRPDDIARLAGALDACLQELYTTEQTPS